ncbi:MAG: SDR family oxidoreductase [Alphaproteobacteria bacterium]
MTEDSKRAALVTGAGVRIGRAIALDLARHGWSVAVHHYGSAEAARETVAEIAAMGRAAALLEADLTDEARTRQLIPEAAAELGPITCLVNNASQFENDRIDTATRESWDAHMEVNLRAPFLLIQSFAEALPSNMTGAVVNMIDQRVWNLTPYFVSYTVSKAGLWTLTRTLALALAPRIRVNAIGPGPALPSHHQTPEQFAAQSKATPLQRGTSEEEICEAVRFILAAAAMTGQMIALDGGQHLSWAPPGRNASLEEQW